MFSQKSTLKKQMPSRHHNPGQKINPLHFFRGAREGNGCSPLIFGEGTVTPQGERGGHCMMAVSRQQRQTPVNATREGGRETGWKGYLGTYDRGGLMSPNNTPPSLPPTTAAYNTHALSYHTFAREPCTIWGGTSLIGADTRA